MTDTIPTVGLYQHKTEVTGQVMLTHNGRVINARSFQSRLERKLIMLKWRVKYDLFEGSRKNSFNFIVSINVINMKTIATLIVLAVFTSCTHRKEPMKTETGYVVEKQYFPDTRQTVTGTGFSTSGHLIITSHNIGDKEKYMVIFKCHHGVVFSINKAELYGKLNKGDTVNINYYEIVNDAGEIKDLDFIDANKVARPE